MSVVYDDTAGQGASDRARYRAKIADHLKKAVPRIAGKAPIITGKGDDTISVPIDDGLTLPRYKAQEPSEPGDGVGQGDGTEGDVVGRVPRNPQDASGQPGTDRGEHDVVVDVTLDELRAMIREELQLPPLPRRNGSVEEVALRWTSRSRHGSLAQVDARQTLRQALLRSQAQGEPLDFQRDDLRYRTYTEQRRPISQAAVYLLRDASASMDAERRLLSQVTAWYLAAAFQAQYPTCPIHFWIHDTEAEECDEVTFYQAGQGGGTAFAPSYEQLRTHMDTRYPVGAWDRIVVQFSDGDMADGAVAQGVLRQWLPTLVLFGFVLTRPNASGLVPGHVRDWSAALPLPFRMVMIERATAIMPALRQLLREVGQDVS